MKTLLMALTAAFAFTPPAQAKITRLNVEDISDVQEKVVGKCQPGWGSRMNVVIAAKSEKFVFIYCSEQPLSAPMSDVYPRLRDFLAGPASGSCEIKAYCDQWNRCSYTQGRRQTNTYQLVLISNEKNQILEDYNDIQIVSDTACLPLSCP